MNKANDYLLMVYSNVHVDHLPFAHNPKEARIGNELHVKLVENAVIDEALTKTPRKSV